MAGYTLYGTPLSTYVRTVRMIFAEKDVDYELVDVNIFQGESRTEAHRRRHPFGKVPALEAGELSLFETAAIAELLEGRHPAPALQPRAPEARALMRQWQNVVDHYIYPTVIGQIVWQRVVRPNLLNEGTDEVVIESAMPAARQQMGLLEGQLRETPWLSGEAVGIADLYLAPVMGYFAQTPEGEGVLAESPALARWWQRTSALASFKATAPV